MLQSMGSQTVGRDLATEQQQQHSGGKKPASQRQLFLPLNSRGARSLTFSWIVEQSSNGWK